MELKRPIDICLLTYGNGQKLAYIKPIRNTVYSQSMITLRPVVFDYIRAIGVK